MERTVGRSQLSLDWKSLASAVRDRLDCGSDRIADGPVSPAAKWWPEPQNFQVDLLSDLGLTDGPEELVEEWSEEVLAIQNLLDGVVPNEKPSPGQSEAAYRVWRSTVLRARAMAVWEQIGVAIRWREGLVHYIRSPNDVLGAPVIRVLTPEKYVEALTAKLKSEIERSASLRTRLRLWQLVAAVLGLVVFFLA